MNIETFVTNSIAILKKEQLLKESGAVLYSARETLTPRNTTEGKVYFLGTNPGEDPKKMRQQTIEKHLLQLPEYKENEYLNGEWVEGRPGKSIMQIHVQKLFEHLNLDINKICASNLIFKRSPNLKKITVREFYNLAGKCWPVHEMLLDILQARVIIAFGVGNKSPYKYLLKRFGNLLPSIDRIPSGYGKRKKWNCGAFETQIGYQKIIIIGFPHMRYYNIEGKADVIQWTKEWISRATASNL